MKIPSNEIELEKAVRHCKKLVRTRGIISGAAGALPFVGADAIVDIANMVNMLNTINRRFGLAPEQIDGFTEQEKAAFQAAVSASVNQLAGKYITKEVVKKLLAKLGIKIAAKQAAKVAVGVGTAVSVGLGYAMFVQLCNSHVRDCEAAVRAIWEAKE